MLCNEPFSRSARLDHENQVIIPHTNVSITVGMSKSLSNLVF